MMHTSVTTVPFDEDRLLDSKEVADLLGFSVWFVKAHRTREPRIPFIRVGARCVRFRRSDIRAWVEALAAKKKPS